MHDDMRLVNRYMETVMACFGGLSSYGRFHPMGSLFGCHAILLLDPAETLEVFIRLAL